MPGVPGRGTHNFCLSVSRCVLIGTPSGNTHLIVDVTPPLRILSLCSVKGTILAKGYSRSLSVLRMSIGRGSRKKLRPAGA